MDDEKDKEEYLTEKELFFNLLFHHEYIYILLGLTIAEQQRRKKGQRNTQHEHQFSTDFILSERQLFLSIIDPIDR